MVRLIKSIFALIELFFSWLPPYLASFVSTLLSSLVIIFIILIMVKVISIGIDFLKG